VVFVRHLKVAPCAFDEHELSCSPQLSLLACVLDDSTFSIPPRSQNDCYNLKLSAQNSRENCI
jgi:hypothetical protein